MGLIEREEEIVDDSFFLNASLTCQHRVKVMLVLVSAVLFVCVCGCVLADGIKGEGGGMVTLRVRVCGD